MKSYNCGRKEDWKGQNGLYNPMTRCTLNGADATFMFMAAVTVSIILVLAWLEQRRR